MRKFVWLVVISLISLSDLFAQGRVITGKVTDENGNALPNVSVTASGSASGTSTNSDGAFSITVGANTRSLVFSSIDKETQTVTIGASNVLNVVLLDKKDDLDEVIVVAYGTVKRSANVGSSAQISAQEIAKRPITNAINALVASAPGIQTTAAGGQPGSSPGIRLRGFTSINASSSAIVVVDGAVFDAGLAGLNPDDIETITTLKDASSTALYGSRGANGVIMVTTKKGKKSDRGSLNFRVLKGVTGRQIPEYEVVDAFEYYPLMWEGYVNSLSVNTNTGTAPMTPDIAAQIASGVYGNRNPAGNQVYNGTQYSDIFQALGRYNPFVGIANDAIVGTDGKLNPGATSLKWNDDWFDAFYRNGGRDEASITYSGATDRSDYFTSFSYTKERGFVTRSELERWSVRLNTNTQVTDWFKTGVNVSASKIRSMAPADGGIVNPFSFARDQGPIYPVYARDPNTGELALDINGNRQYDPGDWGGRARPVNLGRHAIWENELNVSYYDRNTINFRGYADINFTDWLTLTINASTDLQDQMNHSAENKIIGDGAPGGRASKSISKLYSYTLNQLLRASKTWGQHSLDVLIGHENYRWNSRSLSGNKIELAFDDGNIEFPNYVTISNVSSAENFQTIESYLSRLNYSFDDKYTVSLSARRDGNSKFYSDVRWATFWSVGAGWRIDREQFMQNVSWVNMLKLRSTYGITGNEGGVGNYVYHALWSLGLNVGDYAGVAMSSLPNRTVTWEDNKQFDVGLEFSLLNNRLHGSVEYYNRVTDGLLFQLDLPDQNGGTSGGPFSQWENVASLYNRGIEIELNYDVIRNKDWRWTVGINATTIKNEITAMPEQLPVVISGTKRLEVGKSIYDFYLYQWYGVDPDDGSALYYANNTTATNNIRYKPNSHGGTDTLTTERSNAKQDYANKTSIPDLYGGIKSNLSYKNWDFSFILAYQIGGTVYDNGYVGLMHSGTFGYAMHKDILGRWTTPGQITDIPRLQQNMGTDLVGASSNRWLMSATHLNISNVNIGYNFTSSVLNKIGAKTARLSVSGENLALFAKRRGTYVNQSFAGTTSASYPTARVVSVGLNVGF